MSQEKQKSSGVGKVLSIFFFGIFILAGLGFGVFWAAPVFLKSVLSESWQKETATILYSAVTEERGAGAKGGNRQYGVDIVFSYEWEGKEYRSDKHDFLDFSSSERADKEAMVRKLGLGQRVPCWVNPKNPAEAVLYPGLGWAHLILLLPLVFFVAGCLALVKRLGKGSEEERGEGKRDALQEVPRGEFLWNEAQRMELKRAGGGWKEAVIFLGAALFWNGVVVAFGQAEISSMRGGEGWRFFVFAGIFGVVGVGLFVVALKKWMALRNPRLRVWVKPARVHPGRKNEVTWEVGGDGGRMEMLRVKLCCVRVVVRGSGKGRRVERESLFEEVLFESSQRLDFSAGGKVEFTVPQEGRPTGESEGGEVVWFFRFEGNIPRWPDLEEEFPFPVYSMKYVQADED